MRTDEDVRAQISALRAQLRALSDQLHDMVRAHLHDGGNLEDADVQRLVAQRGCVDRAVGVLSGALDDPWRPS